MMAVSLVKGGRHRECKHDELTVCRTCGDETEGYSVGNSWVVVVPGRGAHRQVSDVITCPVAIREAMADTVAA